VVHGFYDLVGYPPDPPDHSLILLKKKNIQHILYGIPHGPHPTRTIFSLSQPHSAHLIISLSSLISVPLPHSLSLSSWPCLRQEEKQKKEAWAEKSPGLEDEGDAMAEDKIDATAWGKLTWSDCFLLLWLLDLVISCIVVAGSHEISLDLERKWVCVCAWVCCVCDWVLVSNFWQFCFCLWLSLFDMIWLSCKPDKLDRTRLPKPINRPARSDHLNGWSTGWSFTNPTLSGRIKNYPQTRTARPVPTPTNNIKYIFAKYNIEYVTKIDRLLPYRN
jgi:hypothetical protein